MMTKKELDKLCKEAEKLRYTANKEAYWQARRKYLNAQAQWWAEHHSNKNEYKQGE